MPFSLGGEEKSLQTLVNKLDWFQGKHELLASSVLVRVPQKKRTNIRERVREREYKKFAHVIMEAWKSQGLLYAKWTPGGRVVH